MQFGVRAQKLILNYQLVHLYVYDPCIDAISIPHAEDDDVISLPAKCYGGSKRSHKLKTRSQASRVTNSPDVKVPTNIQSDRSFRSKSKRVLQLEKAMSKKKCGSIVLRGILILIACGMLAARWYDNS